MELRKLKEVSAYLHEQCEKDVDGKDKETAIATHHPCDGDLRPDYFTRFMFNKAFEVQGSLVMRAE